MRLTTNMTKVTFDLDSKHSDTYGKQEKTDYNAHYQTNGYHPLVPFDGLTGDFLKAELHSRNIYTSNGLGVFVNEHYNQVVPSSNIHVRRDNGFAIPKLYDLCEAYNSFFMSRFVLQMDRPACKWTKSDYTSLRLQANLFEQRVYC